MENSFESPGKSDAEKEARESLTNIKKLEAAGAEVLSEAEKEKNRLELMEKLNEIQKVAMRIFEGNGYADSSIGNALIELGYMGEGTKMGEIK